MRHQTCYLAEPARPCVALAERFLRSPERTLIPEVELVRAAASLVRVRRTIRVVSFHGAGLRRLGAAADVAHGDHRESRRWAEALFDHPSSPDGIRWRSRVDDDGFAAALFDRARGALRVVLTEPLFDSSVLDVEACLERYGAAVVEGARGRWR